MKQPLTDVWQSVPPAVFRAALGRVVMLLLLAGSLYLAWWSVNDRFPPVDKRMKDLQREVASLEDHISRMQMKWDAKDAAKTAEQAKLAEDKLFNGPAECAGWPAELTRQSASLALLTKAQLGKEQPLPAGALDRKLSTWPATVDLQPLAGVKHTNSPYKRLMEFTQALAQNKKRVDLVELSAGGASNSVSQARAVVELWAQERLP